MPTITGTISVTQAERHDPDFAPLVRLESTVPRDIRVLRRALAAAGHWSITDGEPYSLRCSQHGAAAIVGDVGTQQMQVALLDATFPGGFDAWMAPAMAE
jgi:hypothetical protein